MADLFTIATLGVLTLTSYRSEPQYTDDTPYVTSIGQHVSESGAAVSRDLLTGAACYGDTLVIPGYGHRIVNDTMNQRHTRHVDLWVPNYIEEKKIGTRRIEIYVIKSSKRKCVK